jgi:hypothetical protein
MKRPNSITRRTVLRGAGCAVALPWLESLHALADTPPASAFPKRFGVVFLGMRRQRTPLERRGRRQGDEAEQDALAA